ncbi:acetyl-CoA carboxylase carboxyl transferase subunit alpha [bacterium]|nr:MAG: acetyl-CoA carboxylase carboxyl transferase subunit alpha [bacterium]
MAGEFSLDFERPIIELQKKIEEMKSISSREGVNLDNEIKSLELKLNKLKAEIYSKLTRWQRVMVARHPKRPYTLDYLERIAVNFIELHGDRNFRDDPAVVTGFATIGNYKVVVIGQQKGHDASENIKRNFGMMHPEGYRKALRIMKLGEKFSLPVVIFIDTPGAYPGIGAEERGQAEAIARNIREMARLRTPIVIVIIGEGASGGALGIGVGDVILMLENAWYSVISPEGCAAILFRDAKAAPQSAETLKVTAPDLLELGVIDEIIPEPPGGAHSDYDAIAQVVKSAILKWLDKLTKIPPEELVKRRIAKYRKMGVYEEV